MTNPSTGLPAYLEIFAQTIGVWIGLCVGVWLGMFLERGIQLWKRGNR